MDTNGDKKGSVLVVGGGIAGMQAALDCANSGFKVHLVEKEPAIGGNMAYLDKTFPTNDCVMCMLSPKLVETCRHLNIDIITNAELKGLDGEAGHFNATVLKQPRFVDEDKCSGCGECWEHCPVRSVPQDVPALEPSETLSEEDQAWLNETLDNYREDRAPLIQVLQDINDSRGYLPRPMLEVLSLRLEIPLAQIYRVASFYNAFSLEPVGRHLVEVCIGTACFVRGSGMLLERIENAIGVQAGGTDEDLRFTLRTVRCIGCCALAPAMRIDGMTFGNVKLDRVGKILETFE